MYKYHCTLAVEPLAQLSSQITASYSMHYLRPLPTSSITFVSLKGMSHYCLLLGCQLSSLGIAHEVSRGEKPFKPFSTLTYTSAQSA
jgi:hypothetical protein